MEKQYTFDDFRAIIAKLRAKDGCPWDREQTHESLKSCLIEETYEVIEAIDNKDEENLKEELGDVFLQVMMHAQIADEEKYFTIDDVIQEISEKMVRRHPHVFGTAIVKDSDQVLENWEDIKKKEKKEACSLYEELKAVPKAFPAGIRAVKIQKKAAKAGFEFPDIYDVLMKVHEELSELETEIVDGSKEAIEEELGDLMFSVIILSRFLSVNAENSLTNATEKFINRLGSIENLAKQRKLSLSEMSLEQLKELWEEVKKF